MFESGLPRNGIGLNEWPAISVLFRAQRAKQGVTLRPWAKPAGSIDVPRALQKHEAAAPGVCVLTGPHRRYIPIIGACDDDRGKRKRQEGDGAETHRARRVTGAVRITRGYKKSTTDSPHLRRGRRGRPMGYQGAGRTMRRENDRTIALPHSMVEAVNPILAVRCIPVILEHPLA